MKYFEQSLLLSLSLSRVINLDTLSEELFQRVCIQLPKFVVQLYYQFLIRQWLLQYWSLVICMASDCFEVLVRESNLECGVAASQHFEERCLFYFVR